MSWPCDMISAEAIAKVERKEIFKALYEAADERYKAFVSDMGMAAHIRPYPEDFDALIRDYPLIEFLKFIDTAMEESKAYIAYNPLSYNNYIEATLSNALGVEGWLENGKHELIESGWGSPGNRLLEWVMQRYIWITSKLITNECKYRVIGNPVYDQSIWVGYDRWEVTPTKEVQWPKGDATLLVSDQEVTDVVVTGAVNGKSELIIDWIFFVDSSGALSFFGPTFLGWKYPRQRPITP